MVAFYSALSGDTDVANDRPRLQPNDSEVNITLSQLGLTRGGYYVLAPGAEYGPAKRWPISHFADLARQMNLPVVLLGSGKEADLCEEIVKGCQNDNAGTQKVGAVNLAGKTSLTQALSLISATRCIVSNDSGLMHVAAGFGVRQVAIFGSSSPLHTPPLNEHASVLWLKNNATYQPPLDCAPCFERICPLGHTRCLVDISATTILQNL
jgi:heptosyltransferase-2